MPDEIDKRIGLYSADNCIILFSCRMEFAELIRISRCDRVMLHRPHHPVLDGTLCITGHHLIVSSCDKEPQELWVINVMYLALLKTKKNFIFDYICFSCLSHVLWYIIP